MKCLVVTLLALALLAPLSARAAELKTQTQSGDARIALNTATALKQGKNVLTLTVLDKSGKPLTARDVKVETTMSAQEMGAMGMQGMGDGSAKTEVTPAKAPGTYSVKTSLPFGGNWQMKVSVKQPPANAIFIVPVK